MVREETLSILACMNRCAAHCADAGGKTDPVRPAREAHNDPPPEPAMRATDASRRTMTGGEHDRFANGNDLPRGGRPLLPGVARR
jgi:hypothetical protein